LKPMLIHEARRCAGARCAAVELRTQTQRDERERELRGELVRCKIVRSSHERGAGVRSGLRRVPARTAPARLPRGVPACGPRSQVDHRSKYKRMILWYLPTRCLLYAKLYASAEVPRLT
jgi:hypothetical protein